MLHVLYTDLQYIIFTWFGKLLMKSLTEAHGNVTHSVPIVMWQSRDMLQQSRDLRYPVNAGEDGCLESLSRVNEYLYCGSDPLLNLLVIKCLIIGHLIR